MKYDTLHEAIRAAGIFELFRWPHVKVIPKGCYAVWHIMKDEVPHACCVQRDKDGKYEEVGCTRYGLQSIMHTHFYVARYVRKYRDGSWWIDKRTVRIVE